jgi:hypothetical protein
LGVYFKIDGKKWENKLTKILWSIYKT